jgi:hypothetical protein
MRSGVGHDEKGDCHWMRVTPGYTSGGAYSGVARLRELNNLGQSLG